MGARVLVHPPSQVCEPGFAPCQIVLKVIDEVHPATRDPLQASDEGDAFGGEPAQIDVASPTGTHDEEEGVGNLFGRKLPDWAERLDAFPPI